MSEAEIRELDAGQRAALVAAARDELAAAGAHLVIDTIADLPGALDKLEDRIADGERP